jgi:hypothetical protein
MRPLPALPLILAAALAGGAAPAPTTSPGAPAREVPALNVRFDCGACQPRADSGKLIAEGYNEAATQAGAKVNPAMEATLIVKEYTARDDAARFLVGAFAGKDEIKASVSYGTQHFEVEDYYRNAWLGIDALARKIGELAFQSLK